MAEAAMQLRYKAPLKYIHYTAEITKIMAKLNSELKGQNRYSISAHDAPAAQRAEAFLRTIGKWEEA